MHPLLKTALHRVALGIATLFTVSLVIFSAVETLPGDFAQATLGQSATPETVEAFRQQLGLNEPAPERYVEWVTGISRGDFGNSFSSRVGTPRPVARIIGPRLLNTMFLAAIAAAIAVPSAIALGLLAALYRNSWVDRLINLTALTTVSFPEFFVAYILILVLAVKFPVFPSLSNVEPDATFSERLWQAALPILTLALVVVAHMMRMTRAAIIGLLANPYVEMAQLKGIRPFKIIIRHALPNAWAPIATIVAFNLAYLIAGAVVVEVVFVYPGIGQAMVDAVHSRDIPVVQACAIIFASTYIFLNLIADVISIGTNPRLLHPR